MHGGIVPIASDVGLPLAVAGMQPHRPFALPSACCRHVFILCGLQHQLHQQQPRQRPRRWQRLYRVPDRPAAGGGGGSAPASARACAATAREHHVWRLSPRAAADTGICSQRTHPYTPAAAHWRRSQAPAGGDAAARGRAFACAARTLRSPRAAAAAGLRSWRAAPAPSVGPRPLLAVCCAGATAVSHCEQRQRAAGNAAGHAGQPCSSLLSAESPPSPAPLGSEGEQLSVSVQPDGTGCANKRRLACLAALLGAETYLQLPPAWRVPFRLVSLQ